MDYLKSLSDGVLPRLHNLSYDRKVIEALERTLTTSQSSSSASLGELRTAMEKFLRDTARLAHNLDGVNFRGDWNSFANVREFLRVTGWMTRAESNFAASFYGLLSDSGSHGGESKMDSVVATHVLWSVVELISYRMLETFKRRPPIYPQNSASQLRLAREFMEGIKTGNYTGKAFEINFNSDLSEVVRELLRKEDTPMLWELLVDPNAAPNLRNRAASLLLGRHLGRDRTLRASIIEDMRQYYLKNKDTAHFLVLRGIALALANRANDAECISDYINQIRKDHVVLEGNLKTTDDYYGGTDNAIAYYLNRINMPDIPSAGCVWEIFYLSRRAKTRDQHVIDVLKRRMQQTDDQPIRRMCDEAIQHLSR
jgi:hypothetical protein